MGVDQKRPLVGFAFVAVLCAVLMTVSVGRGWSDVFQPGKPIAAAAPGGRVDHAPARTPQPGASEETAEISIPVELSAQPLGVAVGSPASRTASGTSGADSSTAGSPTTLTTTPRADRKVARQVERADRKAARQAGKADRKAARQTGSTLRKSARQADKADRKAAQAAEKAARKAAKAAEKAARRG